MKKTLLILGMSCAATAFSQSEVTLDQPSVEVLKRVEGHLDGLCRGGAGDDPVTVVSCHDRDDIAVLIKNARRNGADHASSGLAHGHGPEPLTLAVTPKQRCHLMSGLISSAAVWRDNHVPIARAMNNVNSALMSAGGYDDATKKEVEKSVVRVYDGHVSSTDLENAMRAQCRDIPSVPGTLDDTLQQH